MKSTARRREVRCPFCRGDLDASPWLCPRCETPHHAECASLNGKCTIYGCETPFVAPVVEACVRRPAIDWDSQLASIGFLVICICAAVIVFCASLSKPVDAPRTKSLDPWPSAGGAVVMQPAVGQAPAVLTATQGQVLIGTSSNGAWAVPSLSAGVVRINGHTFNADADGTARIRDKDGRLLFTVACPPGSCTVINDSQSNFLPR